MPFRFFKANCIAVGTFNMYIIQPGWLAQHSIIPKGIEVVLQANLEEPGIRLSSPKLKSIWIISPTRLAVETDDPKTDCGALVAEVLERLPETPLKAIGSNVTYKASRDALKTLNRRVRAYDPGKLPQGCRLRLGGYHLAIDKGQQTYNLQMSVEKEAVMLSANTHTALDVETKDKSKKSDRACKAAKSFFNHRRQSVTLLKHLFGAEVRQ